MLAAISDESVSRFNVELRQQLLDQISLRLLRLRQHNVDVSAGDVFVLLMNNSIQAKH